MVSAVGKIVGCAVLVGAVLLWPAQGPSANMIWVAPLEEIYEEADSVVAVRIDSAQPEFSSGRECGTRYWATIVRVFKMRAQDSGSSQLRFGHRSGLSPGKQYLAVLRHYGDANKIYDIYHDIDLPGALWVVPKDLPKAAALEFIRCNGLLSGLDYDGAWEIGAKGIIMEAPLPSSWPESIPKQRGEPDRGAWIVSKDDLFAYLDTLKQVK
jgi:hypothetical protein